MLGDLYQLQNEYQTLVDSLSTMMQQFKAGGGVMSDSFMQKLNTHLAAVAARVNEMGEEAVLSAHTSTSIAEVKALIAEFKLTTTPPPPPALDFGRLLKWGAVVAGSYFLYKYFTKPKEAIDPERTVLTNDEDEVDEDEEVLANSGDEIPFEDLPAYAGGPKRKRHK